MSFESAQTNYEGQKGWNDLTPDALMGLSAQNSRVKSNKVRPRRAAPPVNGFDIPPARVPSRSGTPSMPPLAAPPPASSARMTPPALSSSSATPIAPNSSSSASSHTGDASGPDCSIPSAELLTSIQLLYNRIIQNPSKLSDAEKLSCAQKFEQQLAKLPAAHLSFVHDTLTTALANKAEAKQMLIKYGMQNNNVSAWTVPLRRLIDQQL